MALRTDAHAVSPGIAKEFLQRTLPFSELDEDILEKVSKECSVDFFPTNTLMLIQGATEVDYLYLVQKGGVKLYLKDEDGGETLVDYRGEGAAIGALALIRKSKANLNVETVEDTFFLRVPKEAFHRLLEGEQAVVQYYLKSLSENYVTKAYSEIRRQKVAPQADSGLFLFSTEVADIIRRPPVVIDAGQSIRQAASLMATEGIGSLIVSKDKEGCAGIVTDKDFRYKVVARGLDYDAPVESIMASPVLTIDPHAICFDALLLMMKKQIHHLAIKSPAGVVGMITSHDIMVLQGRSPFSLFKEIVIEGHIEGLYSLSQKIPLVIRTLMEEGAKSSNITRMIAVLNDLILEKLLSLMQDELGPPPVPFCWMLLGSEGRREQTFRTDQDNAIIYQDCSGDQAKKVEAYFQAFGTTAIEHLVQCGFPLCKGDIMASNPKWCQPYSVWKRYFTHWVKSPEPLEVMHATIFFDFRPGFGSFELTEKLRSELGESTTREDVFLRYLASDCLATRPPLSFFNSFIVEKDGEHKDTLDIKKRGLVPFVDFARLLSLKHNIPETNTLARYMLLKQAGHLSEDFYDEICNAYGFLMQIRLAHQLRQMEQGETPNNQINPARLSELERRTLKDAFSVIGRIQSYIKDYFRLNL